MMVIRYFAWLRDHTNCAHETITCPPHVTNVQELIMHLSSLSEGHRAVFAPTLAGEGVIRVAINQEFASFDDGITDKDEVAFFPPVTGG